MSHSQLSTFNSQLIPAGYKQTEVGVIPSNWGVCKLHHLLQLGPKNGFSGPTSEDTVGTPTLSLAATSSGNLILNESTIKHLMHPIPSGSPLFLEHGDVLVQRANTAELVGTTAVFYGPGKTFVYPDLMMRLRFEYRPTAEWFWRYANSARGRAYFRSVAAGSTGSMPKISGEALRNMPVPVPEISEQEAIAEALSDADALIESLEQLLAKKRHLKQGTMQELLTGKKRLPGFSGEWEVKRLGNTAILKARIGWQGLTTAEYLESGEYYLVTGTEFTNGYIDWNNCHFVKENRYKQDKYIQLKEHKEANETLYWLELLHQSEYIAEQSFESIRMDSEELVKLLVSIVKTSRTVKN